LNLYAFVEELKEDQFLYAEKANETIPEGAQAKATGTTR